MQDTEPVTDNMATDAYKREYEFQNNNRLLTILYDISLVARNPKAAHNDTNQSRLNGVLSLRSIMAWSELLRDTVCAKLDLEDADYKLGGHEEQTTVTLPKTALEAVETDLMAKVPARVAIQENKLRARTRPYEIKTIRVKFQQARP